MYHWSLVRASYLYASFKGGIRTLTTYSFAGPEYACLLIFSGLLPVYVFNWHDAEYGNRIKEMDEIVKKHKLNTLRFLQNFLRKISAGKLALRPHLGVEKSICIYIKEFDDSKEFDLEPFNFDEYWAKLSSSDIDFIIKKSRQKWYDVFS